MKSILRLGLLPALFLLFACRGEDASLEAPLADETAPVTTAPETAPGPTVDPGTSMTGTVALQPVGGSGVSGEASITGAGEQSTVEVRLSGSTSGATHQGHVHTGTCDAPGGVVAPLQPISVGAGGEGSSTSNVQQGMNALMDGRHIIVYHEAGGAPGRPVTCGAIPGH